MEQVKNIRIGRVLNNQDPLLLGRLRVYAPDGDPREYLEIPKSEWWTSKDPLIHIPLIPYHLHITPSEDEYVHLIYSTDREPYDSNKFYIPGPISRPWRNLKDTFNGSQAVLSNGNNLQQAYQPLDPTTGKVNVNIEGVYPKPIDNAILGRGTSDVILTQQDVLIRAGVTLPSQNPELPIIKNDKRSFLQVSTFPLETISTGTETATERTFEDVSIKSYVEWYITPNNSLDYDGYINFYYINGNDEKFKISNVSQNVNILEGQNFLTAYTINFSSKTLNETKELINQFIKGVNAGFININGYPTFTVENQFPFFYGLEYSNYLLLTSDDTTTSSIITNFIPINKLEQLYPKVTLNVAFPETGNGLVTRKYHPQLGIIYDEIQTTINTFGSTPTPITYSLMGGDRVYLLSHRSEDKFKVDLKDTLYGIQEPQLATDIYQKTNSMVRGDELLSLLNLIVNFLLTHVHAFPGVAPIKEYPKKGVSALELETVIKNAQNTILNQNIRIN